MLATLAALVLGACARRAPPPGDFLRDLAQEGYAPNPGLSALLEPGTIVQVAEAGPGGERRTLAPPVVVAWAPDCFPGATPHESPYALAQGSGRSTRGFALEGPAVLKLLPLASLEASSVVEHRLQLEHPRVRTLAKADLSQRFSPTCVDGLSRAIRAGDRAEWLAVVIEAITVDRLRLEIDWASGAGAVVREQVTASAAGALEAVAGTGAGRAARASISVADERHTVLELAGEAVVAFRTRPLQPEWARVASAKPLAAPLRDQFARPGDAAESAAVGRVAVRLLGEDGPRRVRLDRRFRSGEAFQLEVTSSRPGWLFVLHAMPGEEPALIWPRPGARPEDAPGARLRAHEEAIVPPGPASLRFDDRVGAELMYVVIRSEPTPPRLGAAAVEPDAPPPHGENAIVQFAVRGAGGQRLRGVVFDPGTQDPDPSVYFANMTSAASGDAVLEFRLTHAP